MYCENWCNLWQEELPVAISCNFLHEAHCKAGRYSSFNFVDIDFYSAFYWIHFYWIESNWIDSKCQLPDPVTMVPIL